nr:MAG TPA: hypothetical protein [Inoviridae sp.]
MKFFTCCACLTKSFFLGSGEVATPKQMLKDFLVSAAYPSYHNQ